jgi:hypothetical protein
MAEIIDTLIATKATTAFFTVNIAAANKRIPVTDSAGPCFMMNSSTKYYFQRGDSIVLLTAGYYLPESFCTTENMAPADPVFPFLQIPVFNAAGAVIGQLPGLGDLGSIIMPFENYEGVYNIYSDINSLSPAGKFKLGAIMFFNSTWISMVNVPADLDGKKFYIFPFIKVLHTLPMVV